MYTIQVIDYKDHDLYAILYEVQKSSDFLEYRTIEIKKKDQDSDGEWSEWIQLDLDKADIIWNLAEENGIRYCIEKDVEKFPNYNLSDTTKELLNSLLSELNKKGVGWKFISIKAEAFENHFLCLIEGDFGEKAYVLGVENNRIFAQRNLLTGKAEECNSLEFLNYIVNYLNRAVFFSSYSMEDLLSRAFKDSPEFFTEKFSIGV